MKHLNYIHEKEDWTDWQWNNEKRLPLVAGVRLLQGQLLGKLSSLGFELNYQAQLDAVALELMPSSRR